MIMDDSPWDGWNDARPNDLNFNHFYKENTVNFYNKKIFKKLYIVAQVAALSCVCLYQTSSFGGINPGTYKVNIKAKSIGVTQDTWVFSKKGKFKSEALGLEKGKWRDTGKNTFKIKVDTKEAKSGIIKLFNMIGLNKSDVSVTIEEIEISGTSDGDAIGGKIKSDIRVIVKRPVKISLNTSGSVDFKGEVEPTP